MPEQNHDRKAWADRELELLENSVAEEAARRRVRAKERAEEAYKEASTLPKEEGNPLEEFLKEEEAGKTRQKQTSRISELIAQEAPNLPPVEPEEPASTVKEIPAVPEAQPDPVEEEWNERWNSAPVLPEEFHSETVSVPKPISEEERRAQFMQMAEIKRLTEEPAAAPVEEEPAPEEEQSYLLDLDEIREQEDEERRKTEAERRQKKERKAAEEYQQETMARWAKRAHDAEMARAAADEMAQEEIAVQEMPQEPVAEDYPEEPAYERPAKTSSGSKAGGVIIAILLIAILVVLVVIAWFLIQGRVTEGTGSTEALISYASQLCHVVTDRLCW